MRTLVISDIHANLTALKAVLEDAASFERVFCLGDLVGYGPDPNECVELLRTLPHLSCVMGNHDAAIVEYIDLDAFREDARFALQKQASTLSAENRDYLELLPITLEVDGITLCHGSPRNPIWEYVLYSQTAQNNFKEFAGQICLVGHSHVPLLFVQNEKKQVVSLLPGQGDLWASDCRFILNPGSVGQPRDHNPKASYAIFDDLNHTWQFRRVPYKIKEVQDRIYALGLPAHHASRLKEGI